MVQNIAPDNLPLFSRLYYVKRNITYIKHVIVYNFVNTNITLIPPYHINYTVWYVTYPACGSNTQSPINILSDQVKYNPNASSLVFTNYDVLVSSVEYDITNNGHTG